MQTARGASLSPSGDLGGDPADGPVGSATPSTRRTRLFVGVALTAYVVDVLSKVVAVERLDVGQTVTVVPRVLELTLTRNPGAAFSLATGFTVVLTLLAVVVCVVVVKVSARLRDAVWATALGLLLGGAVGNLTDRFTREPGPLRGHVVDFLRFPDFPPNWPIFNVADSCICIAAVLIAMQSMRGIGLDGVRVPSDRRS